MKIKSFNIIKINCYLRISMQKKHMKIKSVLIWVANYVVYECHVAQNFLNYNMYMIKWICSSNLCLKGLDYEVLMISFNQLYLNYF